MAIKNLAELLEAVHYPGGVYLQSSGGHPNLADAVQAIVRELVDITQRVEVLEDFKE